MKKTPNYIDAISALLTLKGVGDRKHASTMANILNLQYNSAKQKLDGKRGITLDEVKRYFSTSTSRLPAKGRKRRLYHEQHSQALQY
ncbi:helix-turn-helix domain-containing protein [Serratia ureilytica]